MAENARPALRKAGIDPGHTEREDRYVGNGELKSSKRPLKAREKQSEAKPSDERGLSSEES